MKKSAFFFALTVTLMFSQNAGAFTMKGKDSCIDGYTPVLTGHLLASYKDGGERLTDVCVPPEMACGCLGYSNRTYLCSCSSPSKYYNPGRNVRTLNIFGVSEISCAICVPAAGGGQ